MNKILTTTVIKTQSRFVQNTPSMIFVEETDQITTNNPTHCSDASLNA